MSLLSKEHYEMIEFFDRTFKGQFRLDKEDKSMWAKGVIYQNDDANRLFKAFREGAAYGSSAVNQ